MSELNLGMTFPKISWKFIQKYVIIQKSIFDLKWALGTIWSNFLLQNVLTGRHEACGHDSSLDLTDDLAHSGIKVYLSDFKDRLPLASGTYYLEKSSKSVYQDSGITP